MLESSEPTDCDGNSANAMPTLAYKYSNLKRLLNCFKHIKLQSSNVVIFSWQSANKHEL